MAYEIIRVMDHELVDLSGVGNFGTLSVYLARDLDLGAYDEVTAYMRFHSQSNGNVPTTSDIIVNNDGDTAEDPGANNPSGDPAFQTTLSTTSVLGLASGAMKVIAVPSSFGTVSLSWTVTASVVLGPGPKYVVSLDLICKGTAPR